MNINETLAKEFKLRQEQIDNTVSLIDDGKTIPFIARYRKELTGSLDDQVLREIFDRLTYLRNLEKRKEEITSAITEQEKMTDEIAAAIESSAKDIVGVAELAMNQLNNMEAITGQINDNQRIANELRAEVDKFR